jgi:hypothetical protein
MRCHHSVLLIFAVAAVTFLAPPAACQSGKAIVVDLDGSIEGFASLTTILKSPAKRLLQAVVCSGNSWGHLASIELNVKNFLATAGVPSVVVAVGAGVSMPDAYDPARQLWGCRYSQGFPKTPRQATARGMNVSRLDVDGLFGFANKLTTAPSVGAAPVPHRDALTQIFNTYASVVYITLAGLTSLATYLQAAQATNSLNRVLAALDLHVFENGNNFALDPVATNIIFSTPNLVTTVYTPNLYFPDVTFNLQTWNGIMRALAANIVTDAAVAWLFTAWDGRRQLFQRNLRPNDFSVFFRQRGPATSLVTLCAVDVTLAPLCANYAVAAVNFSVMPLLSSAPTGATLVPLLGNNVTIPVSFAYVPVDVGVVGAPKTSLKVLDTTASQAFGGLQLSVQFWYQWQSYLGIP